MKKIVFTLIAIGMFCVGFAQGINFQGVARSANGTIIAGSNVSLRLSITSKNVDATPEFVETKTVMTNAQGIFSIVVGDGSNTAVVGNFKNIVWSDGPKFLKVEMDPAGGTNYLNMGATQLQYVPYSFFSYGVDAANVKGIVPVKAGGTGVATLEELKTALNIVIPPSIDTNSLSNRINTKLTSTDTASLSNRIDTKLSKYDSAIFSKDISVNGLVIGSSKNQNNIIFGRNTMVANTNGSNNIAVGSNALFTNRIGTDNIAIGINALNINDEGSHNVAIGSYALSKNKVSTAGSLGGQGFQNVAIGSWSLQNAISNSNVAIGAQVLQNLTTGSQNTGLGEHSMRALVTGGGNVSVGYMSMIDATSAVSKNVAVGVRSGQKINGSGNTFLGFESGSNNVGSGNVFIGYTSGIASPYTNVNNRLIIDNTGGTSPLIFGEFDNKKLTINGDLYINNKKIIGDESTINSLNNRIDSLIQIIKVLSTQVVDPLKNVWIKFNFDPSMYNFGSNSSYDDSTSKLYMFNRDATKIKIVNFQNLTTDSITITSPITDLSILTIDRRDGSLYGRSGYGKDKVYKFDFTTKSWVLKVNGSRDWDTFGATDFFNSVDNKVGLFGGYGFFSTKNWIYEAEISPNSTTSWTNTYSNRDNSSTSGIAKATGKKVTYNRNRTKLYLSGGQGSYSGDQFSNSCTTSTITWATDVGKYCWLNDLWEYDLTTKQFTNIIPLNNSTYPIEGLTALDYDNDVLYLMGGRTPMATYNPSADTASNYSLKLYKFPLNNNPNKVFTEVQTNNAELPLYHTVGVMGDPRLYYDGRLKSLIWITIKGIYTIKL